MKRLPTYNIDLGGKVAIIEEKNGHLRWKILGRCFATQKNAKTIIRNAKLSGAWLIDDLGNKEWVSL